MATVTAQELNQDISGANKRAAQAGPVFITHRGRATHVLMTSADHRARVGSRSLLEALRPGSDRDQANSDALDLPVRSEFPRPAGFE
jgi:antitoxin (DNA-binding transcriptional repressor) of toxin-antitoxin stability system